MSWRATWASQAHAHPYNAARDVFLVRDGVPQPAPAPRFSRTAPVAGAAPGEVLAALDVTVVGELPRVDGRLDPERLGQIGVRVGVDGQHGPVFSLMPDQEGTDQRLARAALAGHYDGESLDG